ncbi:MAG: hypothetical protein ACRDHZ_19590, partial [Ktedonobacteraceae bacterium]
GQTTITTTKEANGNTVQTASGNGFHMGETAEVSVDSHGGNGQENSQQGAGSLIATTKSQGAGTGNTVATQAATVSASAGEKAVPSDEQLTYTTVGRGKMKQGTHYWTIRWRLTHPSKNGGYIIQHIRRNEGKLREYWEAWKVPKNNEVPVKLSVKPYDDAFAGPKGIEVLSEARFYEGLKLPNSFGHLDDGPGLLPATTVNPNLSTTNATNPVDRWWDTNN